MAIKSKSTGIKKAAAPFGKPADNESDDDFAIAMPDEGGGVQIPDGPYEGRVVNFEKSKSKSSGNPMWVVDFVITKGKHSGTEFRVFLALTPAAAWKVAETLKALGFKQKVGEQVKFTKADVMGRRVILEIELDTYEGKTRSVVKTVVAHPDGPKAKGSLVATAAIEEDEDEDEEEEEAPAPKKTAKKKATPVVEEEEEEEDEDIDDDDDFDDDEDEDLDDDDDFDDDEDEDLDDDDDDLDEDDEDEDEDDDDDLPDDDDEEEEEAPRVAKKFVAKKAAPAPAKKAAPAAKKAAPAKAAPPAKKKR